MHDTALELPSAKETFLTDLETCERWYGRQVIEEVRRVAERIDERDELLHGDFHPGNVMVDEDGRLLLLDMGEMGHGHPVWDLMSLAMHYPSLFRHDVTRAICERFHEGMTAEMHERVWDGFVCRYYAEQDEPSRRRLDVQAEQITTCFLSVIPAHLSKLPGRDASGVVTDFLSNWTQYREVLLALRDFDQFV